MNDLQQLLSLPIRGTKAELVLALGGVVLVLGLGLWLHDIHSLPTAPAPEIGRTYPLQERRIRVFATLSESLLVHGLIASGGIIAGIGATQKIKEEKIRKERKQNL